MKILHVCPLWYPIAADAPGGIETLLPPLVRHLADLGCENTVVASGDSKVDADLVGVSPVNLCEQMSDQRAFEYLYYEQHELALALELADRFDVVHSHIGPPGYVLSAAQH